MEEIQKNIQRMCCLKGNGLLLNKETIASTIPDCLFKINSDHLILNDISFRNLQEGLYFVQ